MSLSNDSTTIIIIKKKEKKKLEREVNEYRISS